MTARQPARHPYPPRVARALDAIRPMFLGFAADHDRLFTRRKDLAPRFAEALALWQADTGKGLVAFVRALDHDLPSAKADYAHHRSFTAAWYLHRIAKEETQGERPARVGLTPLQLAAVLVKTLLPTMKDHEALWTAIKTVSRWHARDLNRLKAAVGTVDGLRLPGVPSAPRLVRRQAGGATVSATAADHG